MKPFSMDRVVAASILGLLEYFGVVTLTHHDPAEAQSRNAPRSSAGKVLLDPKDTLVLLLDHQTGLFQTVKDIPVQDLRANTVVLAKSPSSVKRRSSPLLQNRTGLTAP